MCCVPLFICLFVSSHFPFYCEKGLNGVIKIRISKKNRQDNGQKNKGTKNDLQNIYFCTYKTKDRVTRTPLKTGSELSCSASLNSSCSTSDNRRDKSWTRKVPGSAYDKLSLVLWFTLSDYHVYSPKVSFNFYTVSAICRHIIGVFNNLVFLVPVLKQYTSFEILAGVLHWTGKQLLSVNSWLFLLSRFHFLLYFYVYHTIHFSDWKWYFLWTWKCKMSIATIYFWNREIKLKVKSGERGYNCSLNNWLLIIFYIFMCIHWFR